MTEGIDYKITYSNNKKVSTDKTKATYSVTFLGNYKGTPVLKNAKATKSTPAIDSYSFTIKGAKIADDSGDPAEDISVTIPDLVYSGKPNLYKSTPYVMSGGSTLAASNYTVSYYTDSDRSAPVSNKNKVSIADGLQFTTVYVSIAGKGNTVGKGNFTGTIKAEYKVRRPKSGEIFDISKARVTIYKEGYDPATPKNNKKLTSVIYNGMARKVTDTDINGTVVVEYKLDGKNYTTLTEGKDYELVYLNNINKGKAILIVQGLNTEYEGRTFIGTGKTTFNIATCNIKDWL